MGSCCPAHLSLEVPEADDGLLVLGRCLCKLPAQDEAVALAVKHRHCCQLLLLAHGPGVTFVR